MSWRIEVMIHFLLLNACFYVDARIVRNDWGLNGASLQQKYSSDASEERPPAGLPHTNVSLQEVQDMHASMASSETAGLV